LAVRTASCLPKYRHYRPKDLAVVRLDGKNHYLGKYDSDRRPIAEGANQMLMAYAGKVGGDRYDPFQFEPDSGLVESDIELSDEMVILWAEDARLLIEPPGLTKLEVRPASATARPGVSTTFNATGYDQHCRELATTAVSWSSSSGTINQRDDSVSKRVYSEGACVHLSQPWSCRTILERLIPRISRNLVS
jgi:hypothetical protein